MLKQFKLSRKFLHKASLAFTTFALLICLLGGCGKRKPPLPPKERVSQRAEVTGLQQGNQVILSWKMPGRNAGETNTLNIDRIDVYRLIEPIDAPLSLSEEDFASLSTLIKTIPVSSNDFSFSDLTYTDTLEFSGQNARIRYAIRFVNNSGQKAAFSNFLLLQPESQIAENPLNLDGNYSQDSINLKWDKPQFNVDGTQPANILGFNVYRQSAQDPKPKILNKGPVKVLNFSDEFFEFEKTYNYFVRAISLGDNGEPIESLNSNIYQVKPIDTFPPNPPNSITIASSPNVISIFFAANIEKDIAGYKIYRSLNNKLPKQDWLLLTPELLKNNTFTDSKIEPGQVYYYYLIAVDKFGNESAASDIVSETTL